MVLENMKPEIGLVNGTIGYVVNVKNTRGAKKAIEIQYEYINSKREKVINTAWISQTSVYILNSQGVRIGKRKQFPLMLAWAVTVNKIQGLTLSAVCVDTRNAFTEGALYVAFSRTRNPADLYISVFDARKIKAHPLVLHFYNSRRFVGVQPFVTETGISMLKGDLKVRLKALLLSKRA